MSKIYLATKEIMPLIKESLVSGQRISLTVTGGSMFPLFTHERDSVVLEKAIVYKPRDIVLYVRDDDTPVLHRIVSKKEDGYGMCGDNQQVEEYPISEEQILGKVSEFVRKGKKISVENKWYKFYSFIWCLGLKHRKILLFLPLKLVSLKNKK